MILSHYVIGNIRWCVIVEQYNIEVNTFLTHFGSYLKVFTSRLYNISGFSSRRLGHVKTFKYDPKRVKIYSLQYEY